MLNEVGPRYDCAGMTIRVWAPSKPISKVLLFLNASDNTPFATHDVVNEGGGYFSCRLPAIEEVIYYVLVLDDGMWTPDPYAAEIINGVNGRSVLRPRDSHISTPSAWRGVPIDEAVIYELHVGAFTPEGSFTGCEAKIPHLAALGVNVIQLMPIWSFPGRWNWGYDSVSFFTLAEAYGSVGELTSLIECAHRNGISIILDVVFNHLGPEGAYMAFLAAQSLSRNRTTPWGRALNLDEDGSEHVRAIVLQSIRYWMSEIGFDGVRVDAGHHLAPEGDVSFLLEIAACVRSACRHENAIVILEGDLHEFGAEELQRLSCDGGFDRFWNSTFAEVAHRRQLSGGHRADEFASAYIHDYAPVKLETNRYISYVHSHDIIGNRAHARRFDAVDDRDYECLLALVLLGPSTPMMFMGDEWRSDRPFYFFCEFEMIAGDDVRRGREAEFPALIDSVPPPMSEAAHKKSVLAWSSHCDITPDEYCDYVTELIHIRRKWIVPFIRKKIAGHHVEILGNGSCVRFAWVARDGAKLVICLGGHVASDAEEGAGESIIYQYPSDAAHSEGGKLLTVYTIDRSLKTQRKKQKTNKKRIETQLTPS